MVKNMICAEKTIVDCLLVPPTDTTPPKFAEKTLVSSHKTLKFAKVFSLKSFPLYGIHVSTGENLFMNELMYRSMNPFLFCMGLSSTSLKSCMNSLTERFGARLEIFLASFCLHVQNLIYN